MTPTHYHINTGQRGTILKIFGGTVCRFQLEEPIVNEAKPLEDIYNTQKDIHTIVCSLDNLKPIESQQQTLF